MWTILNFSLGCKESKVADYSPAGVEALAFSGEIHVAVRLTGLCY